MDDINGRDYKTARVNPRRELSWDRRYLTAAAATLCFFLRELYGFVAFRAFFGFTAAFFFVPAVGAYPRSHILSPRVFLRLYNKYD